MDSDSELKRKIRALPLSSGVYVMKDALGSVVYIGKAKNLKRRVSHYFRKDAKYKAYNAKIAMLSDCIADFDFYKTKSEAEALILESKLIKQWKPRFNTLEKDGKNFLLLRVTTFEALPRFAFCRSRKEDNSLYFGPYLGAAAVRAALNELKKKFGILDSSARPKKIGDDKWLLYDDARADISGFPNEVGKAEYAARVDAALEYLKGKDENAIDQAREKMEQASAELDFEKAAKYRDLISAICETQKTNSRNAVNADISKTPEAVARAAMESLQKTLELAQPPRSIECFDISHISGSFCVASMVHFDDGEPARQKYRHFKIKTFIGNDDFRAMREVVGRRYKRLRDEDSPMPDIVLIDGGKGQVFSAMKAFDEAGIRQPFIAGLAKREETIVLDDFSEIKLPHSNEGLKLLQRVRDEAHRFANSFSEQLRSKKIRESILDDFKSLGQKRKEALLKHFGTIAKIKNASVEELRKVEGIGFETAVALREFLDANFGATPRYRGRIAPTPSGLLHLGHALTFKTAQRRARENNGDLVLRIEDIDSARCPQKFVDAAVEDLAKIGIKCNEGYGIGGEFAPYRQSGRSEFYWQVMKVLIEKRAVYPSGVSRAQAAAAAKPPARTFDFCEPENIFPPEFREENFDIDALENPRLTNWRFRVSDSESIAFTDNNSGEHCFVAGEDFGDFLVWRKSGEPAYELAVVADDHAMKISEVVRGEDLLLSTARQILVYRAMGWNIPEFFHCPLLRGEDGQKLSKSSMEKSADNKWLIRNASPDKLRSLES